MTVELVFLHQSVTHHMPDRGNCDTTCGTSYGDILQAKRLVHNGRCPKCGHDYYEKQRGDR